MVNSVSDSSSGTITSPYSGLMRVSGMASGMDIDGMVSALMKAQSVPLDKMKQNQQLIEWKRDDYRSMYTSLDDLDQVIFKGIGMQSTFNKKTVTSSNDSLISATAVNAMGNTSAQIGVSQLATSASWQGSKTYTGASDTTLSFTVTDPGNKPGEKTDRIVTISISANDTIDDIINKFNSSNLGVTMFMADSGLVMSNNKTGTGGQIKFNDDATDSFMTTSLGFKDDGNKILDDADADATRRAQDAIITYNGYQMTQKSNTFTINGINYTIKGKTSADAPVYISTATDVDSIYNSIKDFVDKYNSVIKTINDKISEKRERDYPPLTDDQRKAMTEDQITKWEEKAKSGMLSNDSVLSSGLDKMRRDLYSSVSGSDISVFSQLSQIGITTSSDYSDNGKLVINETTLRQKIQEDPQAIYELFNSGVRSGDASGNYSYETAGIAKRLRDTIAGVKDQIVNTAGKASYGNTQFQLGRELIDISKQISNFQDRLSDMETRYYNQFTAMEQAMQQANNQAAYIYQAFSS